MLQRALGHADTACCQGRRNESPMLADLGVMSTGRNLPPSRLPPCISTVAYCILAHEGIWTIYMKEKKQHGRCLDHRPCQSPDRTQNRKASDTGHATPPRRKRNAPSARRTATHCPPGRPRARVSRKEGFEYGSR